MEANMAEKEIKQLTDLIETAKVEIMEARGEADEETNNALENFGILLDQIEHDLIIKDLKTKVDSLSKSATKLTSIVQNADQKIEKIEKIAMTIDKITKAIKVVTTILVKASTIIV